MTTSEMCDKALKKANEVLAPLNKNISVCDNGDETFTIHRNKMLMYDKVPSDRLFLNISVALMASLMYE